MLNSINLLQFCLEKLVEPDSFTETVEGRHQNVQIGVSILNTKESWPEFNKLVARDQETIVSILNIEPA